MIKDLKFLTPKVLFWALTPMLFTLLLSIIAALVLFILYILSLFTQIDKIQIGEWFKYLLLGFEFVLALFLYYKFYKMYKKHFIVPMDNEVDRS